MSRWRVKDEDMIEDEEGHVLAIVYHPPFGSPNWREIVKEIVRAHNAMAADEASDHVWTCLDHGEQRGPNCMECRAERTE